MERGGDAITEIQRKCSLTKFSAALTAKPCTGAITGAALRALI